MSRGHFKWSSDEKVIVDILNSKNSRSGGIKSTHWTIYKSISYLFTCFVGNHDNSCSLKDAYGTILRDISPDIGISQGFNKLAEELTKIFLTSKRNFLSNSGKSNNITRRKGVFSQLVVFLQR